MQSSDSARPVYLIFDIETIPDGRLLQRTKYSGENLTEEQAVIRAQDETRAASPTGSDFLSTSVQIPVAACVARVLGDFSLQKISCIDAPHYRTQEIVRQFWDGLARYKFKLVSFNGRCFDLPVLELCAFRYGVEAAHHFAAKSGSRYRYGDNHLDLLDFLTNYGAIRLTGGLNLLAKILGKPGKIAATGSDVFAMHCQGKIKEINDYCSFDVLDTYFIFLRTRVMTGEITPEGEKALIEKTMQLLEHQSSEQPHLRTYLENCRVDTPWP